MLELYPSIFNTEFLAAAQKTPECFSLRTFWFVVSRRLVYPTCLKQEQAALVSFFYQIILC